MRIETHVHTRRQTRTQTYKQTHPHKQVEIHTPTHTQTYKHTHPNIHKYLVQNAGGDDDTSGEDDVEERCDDCGVEEVKGLVQVDHLYGDEEDHADDDEPEEPEAKTEWWWWLSEVGDGNGGAVMDMDEK